MAMQDPDTDRYKSASTRAGAGAADGDSGSKSEKVVDEAKRHIHEARESLMGEAAGRTKSLFYEQKKRAADELNNVADTFRQTGNRFRDQDRELYAHYAERIAEQVERASGYIREREVGEIVEEVGDFVRREPVLFFGSVFAAGFLIGRLLTGSGQRSHEREHYSGQLSDIGSRATLQPQADIEEEETPYVAH